MRVVVPDPALGVRRRREDRAAGPQDSTGLRHDRHRVRDMLKEVFEYHAVKRLIGERKRVINIGAQNVAAEGLRLLNRVRRTIDARVVREMSANPAGAAAHVQESGVRIEMPGHVAEIARFLVPVEVSHRQRSVERAAGLE